MLALSFLPVNPYTNALTLTHPHQDAIRAYDIKESVIPHRKYQERVRGKWYMG